jgi:hypothetical protein
MRRLLSRILSPFLASPRRGRRPARLVVEALEARNLLTSYSPIQIRHAYGFDRVQFGDASHALVSGNGTGQTIGIVDAFDDPTIASDLAFFDSYWGLAAPPSFSKVNQTGGTTYPPPNGGWATEIALDVEYAHAMAPAANILLVEANDNGFGNLNTAVQYAANHGAAAVSMSYGAGEFAGETGFDSIFTHSGVTYLSSTGDGGAPGGYQAFSPNVVAVGGTSLFVDGSGNYSSESGWSGSGGGISVYENQPAYQNGVVNQWSTTKRTIPDISMDADPNTGVWTYNSYSGGGWGVWGGTSLACPLMAGVTAVADQGRSYLFGRPSYTGGNFLNALYHLPQSDIHDITTGNNGFAAGPGYDLVTGRGTPIASRFLAGMDGAPVLDPSTGALTITGGGHGSGDTITLSQSGGQLVVQIASSTPLPGGDIPASQTFTYNSGQYSSVTVATSDGSTTVILQNTPTVPVTLVGTAGNNTLQAPNTANAWQITGNNAGTLNGTVSFSGFQNLTGGTGNDAFNFSNGASESGTVSGGGTDTLNMGASTANLTVNITGANAGNVSGVVGAFAGIANITTGSGNDTFVFSNGASLSGTANGGGGSNTLDESANTANVTVNLQTSDLNFQNLLGGSGNNTLIGPNANTTWNITAQNAGTLTGGISFSNFQNLLGGSGNDAFVVGDAVGVDGSINGGGGSNTLDESAYTTGVTVNLAVSTATGVGGTFANLQNFVGSSGGGNTLVGPNAATTWNVTAQNAGTLTGGISFTNFQNLTGGSGSDTFVLANGVGIDGNLDGGGGTNTLSESSYTTGITVDLTANAATGVGGNIANFQSFVGGSAGNTLNGPAADTVWNITGPNAGTLTGGLSFSAFGNLNGGAGNDTFVLGNGGALGGASLSGGITGGGGTNTLDYSDYTANVIVDLQTGFAILIAGGVSGINNVHGANSSGPGLYNLLIGSGGNVLTGGTNRRNILVAGGSASTLIGGTQDDLLIGGTTNYDTEAGLVSWQAIAAYWAGTDPYATRVSNLLGGTGVPLLDATVVTGNGGGNTLTGSGELALLYTDGADTLSGFDPSSQSVTITP